MSPEKDATTPPAEETPRKRPMTLSEAGRRGGEKVKRERGRDYYAQIGRKGGASVKERRGPSFYAEIGRKGGEARRRDNGAAAVPEGVGNPLESTNTGSPLGLTDAQDNESPIRDPNSSGSSGTR